MFCGKEAAFSKRLGSETEIEVIGGADKYVAVCRECYHADQRPASSCCSDKDDSAVSCDASQDAAATDACDGACDNAVEGDSGDSDDTQSSGDEEPLPLEHTPAKKQVRVRGK